MRLLEAWRRCALVIGLAGLTAACSGEPEEGEAAASTGGQDAGDSAAPCPAGHVRGRSGSCMPVGIQGCAAMFIDEDGVCRPSTSRCPAGTIPKFDTGCVPVGISVCAPEFLEDDGLCHPTMAKCPAGTFAVPSEGCVSVDGPGGCGAGMWGNIVEQASDLHVDPAAPAAGGDGSRAKPYKTIAAAMAMAANGDRVVLAGGVYDESVTIKKDIEFVGICSSKVRIQGAMFKNNTPMVVLVEGAGIVALRDLEIGGDGVGVLASYSDVSLDRVHVKNASYAGVVAAPGSSVTIKHAWIDATLPYSGQFGVGANAQGGAKLWVDSSAITTSHRAGLNIAGKETETHVTNSLVEGTLETAQGLAGYGLQISGGAAVLAEQVAVVDNLTFGVIIDTKATQMEMKDSLVEGTLPEKASGDYGYGIEIVSSAHLLLERTVVMNNRGLGVLAGEMGTELSMTGSLITGTQKNAIPELSSPGVTVGFGATATLSDCAITSNEGMGIVFANTGTSGTATRNVIEGTLPWTSNKIYGTGVGIVEGAHAEFASNAILSNHYFSVGVVNQGSELIFNGNLVEGTLSQLSNGLGGRGIEVGYSGKLTMSGNHLNRNHEIGIAAFGKNLDEMATLTMNGDLVSNTLSREIDGEWGAGLLADVSTIRIQSAVFTNNIAIGAQIHLSTVEIHDTLVDGVLEGKFTLKNPVDTFEDICDGIIVRDSPTVNISNVEVRNCCRAGLVFQASSGLLASTTSTQNRFGLVLQGMPRPTVEATNQFQGNSEQDQFLDGDLPVPDALPALPAVP